MALLTMALLAMALLAMALLAMALLTMALLAMALLAMALLAMALLAMALLAMALLTTATYLVELVGDRVHTLVHGHLVRGRARVRATARVGVGVGGRVGDGVHALVRAHLGAAGHALDLLDISLDGHDGDAVRRVDVVPHAEVGAALRDDDVAVGHPLDVAGEGEERRARLRCDVEEVQRAPAMECAKVGWGGVGWGGVGWGGVRCGGVWWGGWRGGCICTRVCALLCKAWC
jgi:hypothetical protein